MDLGVWLQSLGLEQYEKAFRENFVDETVLPSLTAEDLKDLGVGFVGHRRKLLDAIAVLRTEAKAKAPPLAAPSAQLTTLPVTATSPDAGGERRYLTVMFCDLVGSTGISAQLDAEEWRDLVGAYLDTASAAVAEMGGHVAKKLGDGLLALFGYPTAQENDAERAARAGLAILRSLADLNRKNAASGKPELAARIGLDTGPAVVDAAGEIYGDVANIAARVQALAEPGALLVTARVQRQVAGLFVAEERGSHALKGIPEPTVLFRLVRASGGGRRSGQRELTPLVGRDDEIALLTRRWERARQGDGQLVMIVGEPGLGKSRLIEEFHFRLSGTPHTWVEWSCSQLLQNTPLHPIAEWGRQRFGGADVPAERRLAELESSLAQVKLEPAENIPLLAPLLDMPLSAERASALAPEELRRRQLAALTTWVLAGAKVQPLVLAFEDLHWADPTTIDVLRGIAERGALAPLFVLATGRPEFRAPWGMRSHHATISLAPLDRAQVRDMVAELSARHALPQDVVEDVAARTGGVPLFIEEVTRLLLERSEQGGIPSIPPTLQQSLMARLDRLGPAREVAQIASVIGRGFSYSLLHDAAGLEDAALRGALEKLAEADIVLVQGLPPDSDYRFKHALIQDAAYENLLKSRRQVLHRRVAEILRDRFADSAAAEPEALAHHFTQAGMTDAAIEWWGKAGDQALRRSAFQEAISHLGKAIDLADKDAGATPQTATPAGARVKLQTNFGAALIAARGDASPETTAAFARARELAAAVADPMERLSANYGLWVGSLSRGEVGPLRAVAEAVLRDIEGKPPSLEVAVAHRLAGTTEWYLGNFELARAHVERALAMFDPVRDRDQSYRFGRDVGVSAMVFLALARWPLGEIDEARRIGEQMLARALASGHMLTTVYGHFQYALLHVARRDATAALPLAEAVVKLAREHGMPLYTAYGEFLHPWARWYLGERQGGLAAMRGGIAACHQMGNHLYMTLFETALAEAEAQAGEIEAALATVDHAVALTERTGQRWCEADTHRVRGEILLRRDLTNPAPAEEALLAAVGVAQQQKARSLELRAALSLAKLYQSAGRAADAHAMLAPALEGFAPTPEFPEVAQAQTLLAALAHDDQVSETVAKQHARAKLHVDYARAVQWGMGFAADETKSAFARADALAVAAPGDPEYWALMYGRFANFLMRGEFIAAHDAAASYLRQAQVAGRPDHVVNARRLLGTVKLELGTFQDSRDEFEALLANWDEDRDRALRAVTGADVLCVGWAYMAQALVCLGEVEAAVRMSEAAIRRADALDDFGARAFSLTNRLQIDALRGRPDVMREPVESLRNLVSEKGTPLWELNAKGYAIWARGPSQPDPAAGANVLGEIIAAKLERKELMRSYHWHGLIAQLQSAAGAFEDALVSIAKGLEIAAQTGGHCMDSYLYRVRGDVIAKRDCNTAEAAYHEALRIAREQGARTFGLQAAHALGKLYRSMNRAADAHAVLAAALEGFSPTSEFPEIEEAQKLLAALVETDEVKNAAASRQRRLKLQTSYGQALFWSKGFAAEETKAAFIRAQELAAGIGDTAERFPTYYGLWVGGLLRGELAFARQTAETFLDDARREGRSTEIAVATRNLGFTYLCQGELSKAEENLEEALRTYDPKHDRDATVRFAQDHVAASTIFLALTKWLLGEVGRARTMIDEAVAISVEAAHAPTAANVLQMKALFELLRNDAEAARHPAEAAIELSQKHGLTLSLLMGELYAAWVHARLDDGESGTKAFRGALEAYVDQGNRLFVPIHQAALAEIEAERQGGEAALALLDEALALAEQTGERWTDAFLHRVRGEVLLKRDPTNAAPAEQAFLTAIAIAQQQKAKSFELRAAICMARLWRDQGKRKEARELLAPVYSWFTEGFDARDLKEAKALLDSLAS